MSLDIPLALLPARLQTGLWRVRGKPIPAPPAIKHRLMGDIAQLYELDSFVETGTFRGQTVWAVRKVFKHIHSVELSSTLHEAAVRRFASERHITLHHGDSGEVLEQLVPTFDQPTLFWLDSHYSAGVTARGETNTPVMRELAAVAMSSLPHVILIDDARDFTGTNDYPTLMQVRAATRGRAMVVHHDIILLLPDLWDK